MRETSNSSSRTRRWALAAIAAAFALPLSAGMATAADDPSATTPDPTTPTSPAPPNLNAAATATSVAWTIPDTLTEEERFTVKYAGGINGQATVHFAFLPNVAVCPASPITPTQTAGGTRVPVQAVPQDAANPLGAVTSGEWGTTVADYATGHLCGWLLASPSSSVILSSFDRGVTIASKVATLSAELPAAVRSSEYFTVKLTGTNPGTSRRALIMAEKNRGQNCADLVKAATGKRPLQSVVALPKGSYTKSIKLRFKSKTAGAYLLCVQIVEIKDRQPEALASTITTVGQTLRCDVAVNSMSQRVRDLGIIKNRRDSAKRRLSEARKKVAPLRKKYSKQKSISQRRIATARKAVTKAKSKAGKKKAARRLASLRRSEAKRLTKAGSPYRAANASVRRNDRTYKQHRTGVKLLEQSIARTKKDVKKYCA